MKMTRAQQRAFVALYSRQLESAERNKRPPDYSTLADMWRKVFQIGEQVVIPVYGINAKIDQAGKLTAG